MLLHTTKNLFRFHDARFEFMEEEKLLLFWILAKNCFENLVIIRWLTTITRDIFMIIYLVIFNIW